MQPPHDAWLVDLDGTLYSGRQMKLAMAAELALTGPRHLRTLREFRRQHEALRAEDAARLEAETPFDTQVLRTARALGRPREEVEHCVREWMIQRPCKWLYRFRRRGLIQQLVEFCQAGGKAALVSDYPARDKLQALGCAPLFSVVVANGEAGGPQSLKPDPAGYRLAAERLGVAPDRCLVIGDRVDADGKAAERAGMAFRRVA